MASLAPPLRSLRGLSSNGSTLVTTVFDRHYAHLASSWSSHLARLSLPHQIMLALDNHSLATGVRMRLPVISIECALHACRPFAAATQSPPTRRSSHRRSAAVGVGSLTMAGVPSHVHPLLSTLRALSSYGYHVLFLDMDVLVLQPLPRHPHLGPSLRHPNEATGGYDLLVSTHAHHPRVNIGLMLLRATTRSLGFLRTLESNWRASHAWDQSLFDALLPNYDSLPSGLAKANPPVRWARLDACSIAECGLCPLGQCAGAYGSLTRHTCNLPPRDVYTWHLTALNTSGKVELLSRFYAAAARTTDLGDLATAAWWEREMGVHASRLGSGQEPKRRAIWHFFHRMFG